jgi:pSer/pThr/pTyr-binding forkhead associated (FHA) protein
MDPMATIVEESTVPSNIIVKRKERSTKPHFLFQTDGDGTPRTLKLEDDCVTIGRSEEATFTLASKSASRTHAKIERDGDEFTITDCGSRNGISLNGLSVHSAVLRDNDIVQIVDTVFLYSEG